MYKFVGHITEGVTRAAAKALGWEIAIGSIKPWEACIIGKAKQINVSNNSDHEPDKGNDERIFIDISSVKGKKDGPPFQWKQHWRVILYEQTNLKFTKIFSTKNGMIEPILEQIEKWKIMDWLSRIFD